jgi:hypothetical protein
MPQVVLIGVSAPVVLGETYTQILSFLPVQDHVFLCPVDSVVSLKCSYSSFLFMVQFLYSSGYRYGISSGVQII